MQKRVMSNSRRGFLGRVTESVERVRPSKIDGMPFEVIVPRASLIPTGNKSMIELTNISGKPLFVPLARIAAVDSINGQPSQAAVFVEGVPNHFVVRGTPREVNAILAGESRPQSLVPETT